MSYLSAVEHAAKQDLKHVEIDGDASVNMIRNLTQLLNLHFLCINKLHALSSVYVHRCRLYS